MSKIKVTLVGSAINRPKGQKLTLRALGLQAHPEGGHYHEIYRAAPVKPGGRSAMTSIAAGDSSMSTAARPSRVAAWGCQLSRPHEGPSGPAFHFEQR